MAATTDAQRIAFATAAESLIAVANAVAAAGILTALVILKGVFHKGVAYLGIATGAIGIISESFGPFSALAT